MKNNEEEIWLQGQPVSDGIAIGIPFFLDLEGKEIPEFPITLGEVDQEIARYRDALSSSRQDLQELEKGLIHQGSEDAADIIASHIEILDDPLMTTGMEEKIRQMLHKPEFVFQTVIGNYAQRYSQTKDLFFQERLIDVMDLAKRVLRHLCLEEQDVLLQIPVNSIVFARMLEPSYTAEASLQRVHAFVTEIGGVSSHAALIARAKGIPYVVCPDLQKIEQGSFASAIVDGQTGDVILNPSAKTLQKYHQKKTCMKTHYQILQKESRFATETADGKRMQVYANIGHFSDLKMLKTVGADGIGLFRSEYLLLEQANHPPTENFQYQKYKELIESAKGQKIVFRVFDVGGDKHANFLGPFFKETNPMLGCRGIRFLLKFPLILKTQLKAIFKAAQEVDVGILFPFIADVEEWALVLTIVSEVQQELGCRALPLGCMIELPSAVFAAGKLAEKAQFLSIGTNDLQQYAFGIDRNNPVVGDAYSPVHPSLIKMLHYVLSQAKELCPVTICGEMVSHIHYLPLLVGLGMTEFSCAPRYIPLVKNALRKISCGPAEALAQQVLLANSAREVTELLKAFPR